MARIQNPRRQRNARQNQPRQWGGVTANQARRASRPTATVALGGVRPLQRNTPPPPPPPAQPQATPPEADPTYQRIKGAIGPSLIASRQNIDAQQHRILRDYGLGPYINPTSRGEADYLFDNQGLFRGYRPGSGTEFDYAANNPQSLAARLQRNYELGLRGAETSLAARGLRRSGAMDRQRDERETERLLSRADLARQMNDRISELEGQFLGAYRDAVGQLSNAMLGAVDRQVANAPAATPATSGGAGKTPKVQPGGVFVGKGANRIGIGGAQVAQSGIKRWADLTPAQRVNRFKNASPQQRQRILQALNPAQRQALRRALGR